MSASDNFQALRAKMKGVVLPEPPKPADAPENLKRADLVTDDAGMDALAGDADHVRLHEAAAGELSAANDAPPKPRKPVVRKQQRTASRKSDPQGRTLEGYKQLSGRVPDSVHLDAIIAAKRLGVDVGEIITEALAMWHKKNGSDR